MVPQMAFEGGWNKVKLYFMLGLPTETEEDMQGDRTSLRIRLRNAIMTRSRRSSGTARCQITVSTSFFVPKPFTPFQWAPMCTKEELLGRAKVVNDTDQGTVKQEEHSIQLA